MTTEITTIDQSLGVVEVRDNFGNLIQTIEPSVDVLQIVTTDLVGAAGPAGPVGVPGPPGVAGPQGPQGPYAPQFEQTFSAPLRVWTILHNLDAYPVVNLYDLYGFEISGDITMPDRNTVVVTFAVPFSGTARLKA